MVIIKNQKVLMYVNHQCGKITQNASVIISIEDSTPVDMINSMKGDLATL